MEKTMAQPQHRPSEEPWLSPLSGGNEAPNFPAGVVSERAEMVSE